MTGPVRAIRKTTDLDPTTRRATGPAAPMRSPIDQVQPTERMTGQEPPTGKMTVRGRASLKLTAPRG